MSELLLDLRVAAPPDIVAARLVGARTSGHQRAGNEFEVHIEGSQLRVSPPPNDDLPRAVCTGSITPEESGSRLQVHRASLAPNGRAALATIGGVAVLIAAFIALQGWREANLNTVWAALGFVAFFGLVLALVARTATGAANDAVIAFMRRAMTGDASSVIRAAG